MGENKIGSNRNQEQEDGIEKTRHLELTDEEIGLIFQSINTEIERLTKDTQEADDNIVASSMSREIREGTRTDYENHIRALQQIQQIIKGGSR